MTMSNPDTCSPNSISQVVWARDSFTMTIWKNCETVTPLFTYIQKIYH